MTTATSIEKADIAGCYQSKDFSDGDSQYAQASHLYLDSKNNNDGTVTPDGVGDFLLGTSLDPELNAKVHSLATGDDTHGHDDEDLAIPSPIIVETPTAVSIPVVGNGYINIWVDLNNDFDFDDPNEHLHDDTFLTTGTHSLQLELDAASAFGYSGDTTMRIRFCSTANNCDTPHGEALDGEVEDHLFELLNRIVLSGYVFEDNGINIATAHDGIKASSEVGLKDFDVTVTFNDSGVTGVSAGDVISAKSTRGDGYYKFILGVDYADKDLLLNIKSQSKWVNISEADVSAISQVSSSSVFDNEMAINASAGDDITGLNFGKVTMPRLTESHTKTSEPGKPLLIPHKFNLNTEADITFNVIPDNRNSATSGWVVLLYHDQDCDLNIDETDPKINLGGAQSVSGTTEICIISRVNIPSTATNDQQYQYQITADVDYAQNSPFMTQLIKQAVVSDTIKVTYSGAGELKLSLTVNNITTDNQNVLSNQGTPNDILEYVITYSNVGTGPISDIDFFETTPPFTELSEPITCSTLLPCNIDTIHGANQTGYQGDISWTLTGQLLPGQRGEISYRVKIED